MRTVTDLPYSVKEAEHLWIPLADGHRLAARLWRPVSSDNDPVPALLEFIPYRKRDLTALRDSQHHPYLAGHGYACARVDLRGSGDSDGVLTDEYLEQELLDAEEVLAWLAQQPWCTGKLGMMGISWGGFNALQVAARRPPGLSAIVSVCASDDRYTDDVHYMGGCLLSDNLSWASTMFAYNSSPPDPALVGTRWRDMWHQRLEHSGLWLSEWLSHQRRDDYWRHGSVCEDYSQIQCPVMAVSGWADGYSNGVFRLLENLRCPRKGLIGPWSHKYPHLGKPGPAIGFLQELVRWWDRWLSEGSTARGETIVRAGATASVPGAGSSTAHSPVVAAESKSPDTWLYTWMQESMPPSTAYAERPGRWVADPGWPSPNVERVRFPLGPHSIHEPGTLPEAEGMVVESPLSVGQFAGKWCSYNAPPDLPYDQREEDGGSLVFDSEVLTERTEILGGPVAELEFMVNRPVAMVAVRLSDVAPDGRATRVTYGLLNLTHRESHAEPEYLVPNQRYHVQFRLNGVAQAFPEGHRIRLAISTSYWPLAWPPPQPVRLTVFTGASAVWLPVRTPSPDDELARHPFGEPEAARPIHTEQVRPGEHRWTVSRDLVEYESALEVVKDLGKVRFTDISLDVTRRAYERYRWVAEDFQSTRGEIEWLMGFSRGNWQVNTVTRTVLDSTPTHFRLHARLDAYESDERVFSQNWHHEIPRDYV